MKKIDCTPEAWAEYLARQRQYRNYGPENAKTAAEVLRCEDRSITFEEHELIQFAQTARGVPDPRDLERLVSTWIDRIIRRNRLPRRERL